MAQLKRLHPIWPTWAAAAGLALLFIGERLFVGDSTARIASSGLAFLALAAALAVRLKDRAAAPPAEKTVQGRLAGATGLLLSSMLAYAVTVWLDPTSSEASERLHAAAWIVSLVALSVGAAPLILLETTIAPVAFNPSYELRRVDHAWNRGLSFGLLIPVLFLLNFLVERHDVKADLALGSVTRPSEQTTKAVRELTRDVRVVMFYPRRNEVADRLQRYFDELESISPFLRVEQTDQALARDLSKTANVPGNGYVVVMRGEKTERIRVDENLRAARSALRRLDSDFLKRLLRVSASTKVAYFTTGHDERAYERPDQNDPRTPVTFLARQLENMQYIVKPLGLAEGLQTEVPDDASLVFVMDPEKDLLPAEQRSLKEAVERGARVFVALDDRTEARLEELFGGMGLSFDPRTLADERSHVALTRSKADRVIIPTNEHRRHPATETLGRNRNVATLYRGAGSLTRDPDATGGAWDVEIVVDSLPTAFVDDDGDFERDPDEPVGSRGLMAAVSTTSTTAEEGRLIVLSDADAISDELVQQIQGNVLLLRDAVFWLQKEEDPVVTVESDEDIKIIHRREEDVIVFHGTTFGVPLLVLGIGWLAQRRRRKS